MQMDIQTTKIDLIQWLAELQDKTILEKLQSLKEEQEGIKLLSAEQKVELDRRFQLYKKGEMSFSSWEEAKGRIRNEAKDAL